MSNRLDKDREQELSPKRMKYAKAAICALGYEIIYEDATRIEFMHRNEVVKFFAYSGWHTGKSIKDGRGIGKLLEQLRF